MFGLGVFYGLEAFAIAKHAAVIFKSTLSSNLNIKRPRVGNSKLFLNPLWQIVPTIELLPPSMSLKKKKKKKIKFTWNPQLLVLEKLLSAPCLITEKGDDPTERL